MIFIGKILNFLNSKLKNLYEYMRYNLFYKEIDYLNKQNSIYLKYNLNREDGLKKLNKLLSNNNDLLSEMLSEHSVIFSSISNLENKSFMNILEIGTYDGKNALLLAKLFENSTIDTVDLPDNDEIFLNSYQRENIKERKKFCDKRNFLLKKTRNINFIQINSLQLIKFEKKYDLIWIDGAHGYPYSTIDIINSLKLINDEGIILCDDVYTKTRKNDKYYVSTSSYETLLALEKAKIIKYDLFYKRLDKKINSNPYKKKYIGIISYKNNI